MATKGLIQEGEGSGVGAGLEKKTKPWLPLADSY
jgi:hypothetical protein